MIVKKKTLIIKTGHSETFCNEVDVYPSLGDVLRTTVLLNLFDDSEFYWLVSPEAYHLISLEKDNIFLWTEEGRQSVRLQHFDRIVNLEKGPDKISFLTSLDAQDFYGFVESKDFVRTPFGDRPLSSFLCTPWQKGLFQILGQDWSGEEYILKSDFKKCSFDIGINWQVRSKWTNKQVEINTWKSLEQKLLAKGYTVSWQEGLSNLKEYIDWIASNRLILTLDSLGLHIALAIRKEVIAIFGPTSSQEIHLYDRGEAIFNPSRDCLPCQKRACSQDLSCMEGLDEDYIIERIVARLETTRGL